MREIIMNTMSIICKTTNMIMEAGFIAAITVAWKICLLIIIIFSCKIIITINFINYNFINFYIIF